MNKHRKFVQVDPVLVEKARKWGEDMTKFYASKEGQKSPSRSRSGIWGAEKNPVRLGQSKTGEYAVASFYNLDPEPAVNLLVGIADKGDDIWVTKFFALDVKTNELFKYYMVWSKEANDLYWQKIFHALVCVSIDDQDWSRCWIEGWVTKQKFFDHKRVADGINDKGRLTPGTWFVGKSQLWDIELLSGYMATSQPGFVGYDHHGHFVHYCHCGQWGSFSTGVRLLKDQLGRWYCAEHRPLHSSEAAAPHLPSHPSPAELCAD